ncbi:MULTISPECIES: threonine/serine exporter family protein [unclassified Micrococcus]|uniref:threonine/serine ThrE exporter family protein n=1 Tax=unclassified Micrococcus TaxID=2620948 RepID=UPI002004EF62
MPEGASGVIGCHRRPAAIEEQPGAERRKDTVDGVDPDGPQEAERFDPRIPEPAAEPTLIPVIRPAAAAESPGRPVPPVMLTPDSAVDLDPLLLDEDAVNETGLAADPGLHPDQGVVQADGAEDATPTPAADSPLTEPPLSEQVPTSVLSPADADGALPAPAVIPEPDVTVPDPVVPHGPPEKKGRRRGRRGRQDRAVFEEALPTQTLAMVERLQSSPYGRRMRSTLQQRRDVEHHSVEARTTLDFALKLGETMFSFGATSLDVETSIIVVTQAYGIQETEVDLTNQAISLNYAPDSSRGEVPYTLQRVVRSSSTHFDGLVAVHRLVEQISEGKVERSEAQRRLVEIRHRPKPFPPFFEVLFAGVFAGCFVPFIGGSWEGALLGMVSTWLVFWLKVQADRARFPEIFSAMFAAFLATVIALVAFALRVPVNPAVVTAGGIMMLLPTVRFVTATQDAINGFPVTAAGRFISALLVYAGIMGGIMLAVGVAEMVGLPPLDLAETSQESHPFLLLLALVAVASMSDAVVEQNRSRAILASGAVSAVGYLVFTAVTAAGTSGRLAPAIAAAAIGFTARIVAERIGAPALVVALPSVLFLLPGLTIFRSLYGFTVESKSEMLGIVGIVDAIVIVAAIAAGVALGNTVAKPVTDRLRDSSPRALPPRLR